jgi:hypothetical protein
MFGTLADIANDLTPKNWNPTALSLFVNAVVKMGMTSGAQVLSLLALLVQKYNLSLFVNAVVKMGMTSGGQVLSLLALLVQKYKY